MLRSKAILFFIFVTLAFLFGFMVYTDQHKKIFDETSLGATHAQNAQAVTSN